MKSDVTLDEVHNAMKHLDRVVDRLREEYPRMELGQLSIFLKIALHPGRRFQEYKNQVGLSKGALSRNIAALSSESYLKDENGEPKEGISLITWFTDPDDQRNRIASLTRRGKTLTEDLTRLRKKDNGSSERKEVDG